MSRRRAAFTLLEVLAAVMVVGMTFTVLARANIEGLRAEGIAARRLEASLVGDRVVAELEAQLAAGTAPQVGDEVRDVDGFTVRAEVTPLELTLAELPPELAGSAAVGDTEGSPSLLTAPDGGAATPLRHVRIEVVWNDGVSDQTVVRDTFVFDAASVASYLEPLESAAESAARSGAAQEEEEEALTDDEDEEASAAGEPR